MKRLLFILLVITTLHIFSQTPITASIPYQGYDETQAYLGQGEYQIFIDNTNGVLDKPIILLDGFDPGDTRNINGIYNFLNYNDSNVGAQLRADGFDLIILNFPTYIRESDGTEVNGGADYIQRNAMILIELINQINDEKIGTEELVIVGPSMGGLISRYALRYMEQQSLEHETRLFVSWDVPHKGASVPISLQYLINYFGEAIANEEVQSMVNAVFNSPATKEMLIDHYVPHLQSESSYEQDPSILLPVGAVTFRNNFQNELDAMGFPQQTRNICISNGSANGNNTGSPGMEILNHTFDVPNISFTTMEIALHFTPLASQDIEVTKLTTRFLGVPIATFDARAASFDYTNGLDSAPGGMYEVQTLVGAVDNPLLVELIENLEITEFCFIPVMSSMAIENEMDWHANVAIPETHTTPFDAWFIPDVNERHITPTTANVAFVLAEINNETGAVSTTDFDSVFNVVNPVSTEIKIISNKSFEQTNVSVLDITGKIITKKQFNNTNLFSLPIHVSNGVYFLKITVNGSVYFRKIIVQN